MNKILKYLLVFKYELKSLKNLKETNEAYYEQVVSNNELHIQTLTDNLIQQAAKKTCSVDYNNNQVHVHFKSTIKSSKKKNRRKDSVLVLLKAVMELET